MNSKTYTKSSPIHIYKKWQTILYCNLFLVFIQSHSLYRILIGPWLSYRWRKQNCAELGSNGLVYGCEGGVGILVSVAHPVECPALYWSVESVHVSAEDMGCGDTHLHLSRNLLWKKKKSNHDLWPANYSRNQTLWLSTDEWFDYVQLIYTNTKCIHVPKRPHRCSSNLLKRWGFSQTAYLWVYLCWVSGFFSLLCFLPPSVFFMFYYIVVEMLLRVWQPHSESGKTELWETPLLSDSQSCISLA